MTNSLEFSAVRSHSRMYVLIALDGKHVKCSLYHRTNEWEFHFQRWVLRCNVHLPRST